MNLEELILKYHQSAVRAMVKPVPSTELLYEQYVCRGSYSVLQLGINSWAAAVSRSIFFQSPLMMRRNLSRGLARLVLL